MVLWNSFCEWMALDELGEGTGITRSFTFR